MNMPVNAQIQSAATGKFVMPHFIAMIFADFKFCKEVYLSGSTSMKLYLQLYLLSIGKFDSNKIDYDDLDFVGKCDPQKLLENKFIQSKHDERRYTKMVGNCKIDFMVMGNKETLEDNCKSRDLTNGSLFLTSDGSFIDPCGLAKQDIQNKVLRSPDANLQLNAVQIARRLKWLLRDWQLNNSNELKNWMPPTEIQYKHLHSVTCQILEPLKYDQQEKFVALALEHNVLAKLFGLSHRENQSVPQLLNVLKSKINFEGYIRKKSNHKNIFFTPDLPKLEDCIMNAHQKIKFILELYIDNQPSVVDFLLKNKNENSKKLLFIIKNIGSQTTQVPTLFASCSSVILALEKLKTSYETPASSLIDSLIIHIVNLQNDLNNVITEKPSNTSNSLSMSNFSCTDL